MSSHGADMPPPLSREAMIIGGAAHLRKLFPILTVAQARKLFVGALEEGEREVAVSDAGWAEWIKRRDQRSRFEEADARAARDEPLRPHVASLPHNVLGISEHATVAEINAAWRRLAGQHHPDRSGGDHSKMAAVNAARDTMLGRRRAA